MERRTSHWMEWNEVEGGEQREDPGKEKWELRENDKFFHNLL